MNKEEFFKGLENRPVGMSPLRWVASLGDNKPEYSEWLLEWVKTKR